MQSMRSILPVDVIRRPQIMGRKLIQKREGVVANGQRDLAPLLGNGGVGHAYLAHGTHWRTRCWGIVGTFCVCLALCGGAFVSWLTPLELTVHQSAAALSVIQVSSPSDPLRSAHSRKEAIEPPKTMAESSPEASVPPVLPPRVTVFAKPTANASAILASDAASNRYSEPASVSSQASPSTAASHEAAEPHAAEPHAAAHHAPPSGQARSNWEGQLLRHLEKFRRYPSAARLRGQQGVAYVTFTMNRSGQVIRAKILQSSKVQTLDRAALDTLHRAQPLPTIPDDMPDVVDITLPVEFFTGR